MKKADEANSKPNAIHHDAVASSEACQGPSPDQGLVVKRIYNNDLEMLKDYFRLIDLKKQRLEGPMRSKVDVSEIASREQAIEASLSISPVPKKGAYLIKAFKKWGLDKDERLLVAVLCYFEAKREHRMAVTESACNIVADGDRIRLIQIRSRLNGENRLVESRLVTFREDSSPFSSGSVAIELGLEVKESLWGKDREVDTQPTRNPRTRSLRKAGRKEKRRAKGAPIHFRSPREIYERISDRVMGQEEAKKVLSVAVYNHYQRINGKTGLEKANILLTGPTGCGKTYLAQTIAELLDVPLAIGDATQYTEAGYVGGNVEDMFRLLFEAAGRDPQKAAGGVIYIDEVDKIAASQDNGKHKTQRDVSGQSVQEELLKMVEGGDYPGRPFKTGNVLFIAGGAFSQARAAKCCFEGQAIGFGRRQTGQGCIAPPGKLTLNDLVSFGMLPELLGRFQVRVALDDLDQNALRKILAEPKDSILDQYRQAFKANGIDLTFADDFLDLVAVRAARMKTGARSLKSVVEEYLQPLMFKHFGEENKGRELVLTAGMFVEAF